MLSRWLVSATPSSGLYTLCPMASTRGARGVTLVVARRGPEGRARKRVLHHDADSDLRDFFFRTRFFDPLRFLPQDFSATLAFFFGFGSFIDLGFFLFLSLRKYLRIPAEVSAGHLYCRRARYFGRSIDMNLGSIHLSRPSSARHRQ